MNTLDVSTNQDDLWKRAFEARERPKRRHLFGQILMDVYSCALVKGEGIVPFDPSLHYKEHVAITVSIMPLESSGLRYEEVRKMVDFEDKWLKVTLPSLNALGISGPEVNGKYGHAELKAVGTYKDRLTGEEMEANAFHFHAVYETEEECEQALAKHFGRSPRQHAGRGEGERPLRY